MNIILNLAILAAIYSAIFLAIRQNGLIRRQRHIIKKQLNELKELDDRIHALFEIEKN